MTTPIKWLLPALLVIVLVLGISYASSVQNINTKTISEVEVLADTISSGLVRSEMDEQGEVESGTKYFDKDELIANLTASVVSVQKNHPYDIHLDYVFLDNDKKVTENDEDIKSVQFRLRFLDEKGEVKATAERHLAIDQLGWEG